jgi:hypothetical protein
VNFSFLTDGRDIFSGYTFLYGGFNNEGSYLYRRRTRVAKNGDVRFNPFDKSDWDAAIDDEHLFWRRFRFEKVGRRLRVFLGEVPVFDHEDEADDMPAGGHVALWTVRNGVMYARLNSSAQRVRMDAAKYVLDEPGRHDLAWRPLSPAAVRTEPSDGGQVRVVNRFGGGTFAVVHPLPEPVDLAKTPWMRIPMDIPSGAKVNLHLQVNGRHYIHALTAPLDETYRVLGDASVLPPRVRPAWRLYASQALQDPVVGGEPRDTIRGVVEINLLEEVRRRCPHAGRYRLATLIVGNTSHSDYLVAGLGGNAAGASYTVGTPTFASTR